MSWSRARVMAVVLLVLAVGAGCAVRTGSPTSAPAWYEQADTTLGTALSSLGTAELVLENQAQGDLTRSYVVVTLRDAITVLDLDAVAFLETQPPPDAGRPAREAVDAVQRSLAVLHSAATTASAPDRAAREEALAEVRRTADAVERLQADLEKAAPGGGG